MFVISDTFFGRSSLAKHRGFVDVDKMNDKMVFLWNNKISKDDEVIHLGNFAFDSITIEEILPRLNGKISIIKGEYDLEFLDLLKGFGVEIRDLGFLEKRNVFLTHWPHLNWLGKDEGVIHLHGNNPSIKTDINIKRFNMNCELWGLSPVSFDSLIDIINISQTI